MKIVVITKIAKNNKKMIKTLKKYSNNNKCNSMIYKFSNKQ